MKQIGFFSWQDFEQEIYENLNFNLDTDFYTNFAIDDAKGYKKISTFVDCIFSDNDLRFLRENGLEQISLRSAGFDMLNVELAKELGIMVTRVAEYSPESIAEFTFALLLSLVRKLNVERSKHEQNLNLRDKRSMGFVLKGKTFGVYGIGKIGSMTAQIARGFGMNVIFYDSYIDQCEDCSKVHSLEELFEKSDIISIHTPLTEETKNSIDYSLISKFPGKIIINTARGDILNSDDMVRGLDENILQGLGVDVWDSGTIDDKFDSRLLRDNVVQTKHIAFLTKEAVTQIIEQTISSLNGNPDENNLL